MNKLSVAFTTSVFVLACPVVSTPAASGSEVCRPISGPVVIREPGCYYLNQDIQVSQLNSDAITVLSSNVKIDLAAKAISGPQAGHGAGIFASGLSNITVQGGRVKGFLYGVRLEKAPGAVVARIDASENLFRGIRAEGKGFVVEMNRVTKIHGYGDGGYSDSHSFGIEVSGPNCSVRNNHISDIYPFGSKGEGVGISLSEAGAGCQKMGEHLEYGPAVRHHLSL